MSILSNFTAYIKQVWANRPTLTSPLSAARLNHMEAGIKANSDAVEAISNAVISNIINDPNKIASMATAYALQQQITKLNSEFYTYTADRIELGLAEKYGAWFRVLKIINVEIAISYSASTNEVLNTMLIRSYVVTEDNWTSWKAI